MAAIPPPQVTRHNQLRSACLAARRLPVTWPTPLLSASRHRDGGRRELLGRSTLTGSGSGKAKTVDPVVFQVTSGPASSTLGSVIRLAEPPRLVWPTQEVRVSYLVGEQADCLLRGTPTQWLEAAGEDFAGNVRTERDRAALSRLPFHPHSQRERLASVQTMHERCVQKRTHLPRVVR